MKIVFHDHAVTRMQERNISVDQVKSILEAPDGEIQQSADKWILYKEFPSRNDNLIAAVIVDRAIQGTIEVITVMINFEVK